MTKTNKKQGKDCVKNGGDFFLPARLDKMVDDINLGTVLKRLSDDRWAVVVDWVGLGPAIVVLMVSDAAIERSDKTGNLPTGKPGDYQTLVIKDDKEWLVIALGSDYVLIE